MIARKTTADIQQEHEAITKKYKNYFVPRLNGLLTLLKENISEITSENRAVLILQELELAQDEWKKCAESKIELDRIIEEIEADILSVVLDNREFSNETLRKNASAKLKINHPYYMKYVELHKQVGLDLEMIKFTREQLVRVFSAFVTKKTYITPDTTFCGIPITKENTI